MSNLRYFFSKSLIHDRDAALKKYNKICNNKAIKKTTEVVFFMVGVERLELPTSSL